MSNVNNDTIKNQEASKSSAAAGSALPILIGCEESQVITGALRVAGHEAYSCDLQRGATRIGITSRILWM